MDQGKSDLRQPNVIDVHVGSRIRLQRKIKGLSQSILANNIGVTFQQIQKYENGRNRVSASRLQAISEVLGVHVSFFFHDQPLHLDEVPPSETITNDTMIEFLDTVDGVALNRAYVKIRDANIRKRVLNLVKSLVEDRDSSIAANWLN